MKNRIKKWVNSINQETKDNILIECIEVLINTEVVNYPNQCKSPYWDATGDALDGIENNWEDDSDE